MIFDFQEIYNNDFITENDNELTIIESREQAKITETYFKYIKIYNISRELLTKTNSIFSNKKLISSHGFGKNCDGAFLIQKDEKWVLCLCELKSSFKFSNFILSKLQLEVSYLKILSLFSTLKGFDPNNFKSVFFIVSEKPDMEKLENKMENLRARNTYAPISSKYHELLNKNKIKVTNDCCLFSNEPIKDNFTIVDSILHFIEGNKQIVDINQYVN